MKTLKRNAYLILIIAALGVLAAVCNLSVDVAYGVVESGHALAGYSLMVVFFAVTVTISFFLGVEFFETLLGDGRDE